MHRVTLILNLRLFPMFPLISRIHSRSQYSKLEGRIKEGEEERRRLEKVVEGLKSTASLHISEKERLEGEIRRLTKEGQQADSLRGNQPPSVWQKMTAATRELRKAEDEVRALQDENAQIKADKAALREQVASQERNLLRLESEGSEMRNDTVLGAEAMSRCVALTAEVEALTTRLAEADSALVEAATRVEAEKENYRREKFWNRYHKTPILTLTLTLALVLIRCPNPYSNPTLTDSCTSDHRDRLEAEIEALKSSLEEERAKAKVADPVRAGASLLQTAMDALGTDAGTGSGALQADVVPDVMRLERTVATLTERLNDSEVKPQPKTKTLPTQTQNPSNLTQPNPI